MVCMYVLMYGMYVCINVWYVWYVLMYGNVWYVLMYGMYGMY